MFDKIGASVTSLSMGVILIVLGLIIPVIGPILIFVGVISLFSSIIGPFLGIKPLRLPCPYCGTEIAVMNSKKGINCKACKQRVVIKDNEFIKINS